MAAVTWYEDQEPRLGERLTDCLDRVVGFVRENPGASPRYRGLEGDPAVRREGVDVFPYGVIYVVQGDEVIVLSYAHERRRPEYWKERLSER